MITLQEAENLCILAHKGQYRKPVHLGMNEAIKAKENGWKTYNIGCEFVGEKPYSSHPIAVADMMSTEYRKILALLHDVIEDTDYELTTGLDGEAYLSYYISHTEHPDQYEISEALHIDLGLITKDQDLTYRENIQRIADSGRKDLIAVKIGDNAHNLSTGSSVQQEKYLTVSLPILLAAL